MALNTITDMISLCITFLLPIPMFNSNPKISNLKCLVQNRHYVYTFRVDHNILVIWLNVPIGLRDHIY